MDEILLEMGRFKVVRRLVKTRQPEPVPKEVVIHPGGAVVLPIAADGRVVMVRNWRWSIDRELLELPSGKVESLEQPETCARRELEEETGFVAGTIRPLCRFFTSPGILTELMYAFVATDLTPGQQNLEEDETIEVEIMSFDELDDAIRSGKVMDGKTLATLLYYQRVERK